MFCPNCGFYSTENHRPRWSSRHLLSVHYIYSDNITPINKRLVVMTTLPVATNTTSSFYCACNISFYKNTVQEKGFFFYPIDITGFGLNVPCVVLYMFLNQGRVPSEPFQGRRRKGSRFGHKSLVGGASWVPL